MTVRNQDALEKLYSNVKLICNQWTHFTSDFEVLREINQDLTDLFDELTSLTNEQLGKKPKKWKNILSTHIKLTNGN